MDKPIISFRLLCLIALGIAPILALFDNPYSMAFLGMSFIFAVVSTIQD
jgi:hypothetical protein